MGVFLAWVLCRSNSEESIDSSLLKIVHLIPLSQFEKVELNGQFLKGAQIYTLEEHVRDKRNYFLITGCDFKNYSIIITKVSMKIHQWYFSRCDYWRFSFLRVKGLLIL